MTKVILCDEKRISQAKTCWRAGKEFRVLKILGKTKLIPVSTDPIKEFAEMGRKAGLDKLSIKEIKEAARKQAEEEIYASLCKD